jgi:hypothetical protein
VTDDAYALSDAALPDNALFGGVPEASRGRRALALAIDVAAVIGSPLLLIAPAFGILVVSAFWAIPLWVLACVAIALMRWAGRQRNGDRLSAGQLVSGLTILRTPGAYRVARAEDVAEDLRPARSRVVTGVAGVVLAVLAAVGIWGTAGFVYYAVSTQDERANAWTNEWLSHEPEARVLVDAFITDLLSANPRGGAGYVAGDAERDLPGYRARIRREGVTAFRTEGSGQSEGVWEYMFREQNPVQADAPNQRAVSIVVQEVDGRLRITSIVLAELYDAPTPETGTAGP